MKRLQAELCACRIFQSPAKTMCEWASLNSTATKGSSVTSPFPSNACSSWPYQIGNRKGALLELKWPQVDFKNGVIRFVRMQNRKPVPLAAPIYGDMADWLHRQKAFRDEHFLGANLSLSGIRSTVKSIPP